MRPLVLAATAALLLPVAGCDNALDGGGAATNCATTGDAAASRAADIAAVVSAANAFYATLSSTQQTSVVLAFNEGNADNWSNLPVGATGRNGLRFSTLSSTQLTAALAVAQAALSSAGYATFEGIRAADAYLSQNGGGSQYGAGLYYIAFLNAPSTTTEWMLQLGGHHYAINIYFNGTTGVISHTPNFVGLEPLTFTLNGTTYAPMEGRRAAATAMLDALTPTQLTAAQLTGTFGDVLLGPGADGDFPTPQGLLVSTLDAAQQAAVVDAMEAWVLDADDATAASFIAAYTTPEALAETRIAWSSSPDLTAQRSYIRIDGPRVWIEIVAQNGVVLSGIHYHSIWRDQQLDYGGRLFTTAVEEGPCS